MLARTWRAWPGWLAPAGRWLGARGARPPAPGPAPWGTAAPPRCNCYPRPQKFF